jgi:hypothetical protein
MAVLGSREQMCIHEEVSKLRGKAQNNGCQFLCKKRRCRHNNIVTGKCDCILLLYMALKLALRTKINSRVETSQPWFRDF